MNLEGNSPIPEPARPMFEDCTVTSVDPLEIQRDCDESPIPFTPDTMIAPELLAVEDRVRVELAGERLIVVGRGNGFAVDSEATAGALVLRDASGRAQFATPSADVDAATKGYVDGELGSLDTALQNLMSAKGVIPSSVDVGSGSASVAADGTVTATDVSWVALNGVHNGLGADMYEYRVWIVSAGSGMISTRLRSSGAHVAGTPYQRTGFYSTVAAGPTRNAAAGATDFGFWCPTAG
ncbi:MAG: hypothetical protein M0R74_20650, partial [Dehalococcoidia bacterium]|nr:hypothetical protein [Dehalococcoidia bacterium]